MANDYTANMDFDYTDELPQNTTNVNPMMNTGANITRPLMQNANQANRAPVIPSMQSMMAENMLKNQFGSLTEKAPETSGIPMIDQFTQNQKVQASEAQIQALITEILKVLRQTGGTDNETEVIKKLMDELNMTKEDVTMYNPQTMGGE